MSDFATGRFGPARIRLVALLTAHTSAQTGNTITVLATPFFVLSQGGSALNVGLASTFATVPIIIGGPMGAVLVDRLGQRLSSIIADVASAATVLAIAVLSYHGLLPFWGFLLLIFASGLLDTPGQTARTVLMPDVSAEAGAPLARTVGFATGAERAATLVGAPLGGFLVSLLGASAAFAVTGVFFVISSLLVLTLVRTPHSRSRIGAAIAETPSYWRDLADGFRFVVQQPLLRLIVVMVFMTNLLDAGRFSVLLPLRSEAWPEGASAVGLISGALGAGALAGSLLFGFIGHRVRRRPLFVVAFLIAGGPLSLAFASSIPLPALLVVSVVTGLASGTLNPIIGTLRLELAPQAMRARAQSLMIAGSWAGIPIGSLLAGASVGWIGVQASFLVIGAIYMIVAMLPISGGAWKGMDQDPRRR